MTARLALESAGLACAASTTRLIHQREEHAPARLLIEPCRLEVGIEKVRQRTLNPPVPTQRILGTQIDRHITSEPVAIGKVVKPPPLSQHGRAKTPGAKVAIGIQAQGLLCTTRQDIPPVRAS